MKTLTCDYLIVGTGIAGLMTALHLAPHGRVLLVTKKNSADSNTNYAQGGISCVMDENDDFEKHIADTLDAGAGLCEESVVRQIITAGPEHIRELISLGVTFNPGPDGKEFDLGCEGGHTHRRILHAGDITGRRIETVLLERIREHPGITLLQHTPLIDLVTTRFLRQSGPNRAIGAYLLEELTGKVIAVATPAVILATGGCGKVYQYTCNPDIATGDGIAIAWRAGAALRNMEMIQFHPTCLYHPTARRFLISEAVRGEGAILVNADGSPFMDLYDARGSLAPRDIVARAIDSEMKKRGTPYCCLDIRHKGRDYLEKRFPTIFSQCLQYGIDMSRDLIPIVPAAHYCCGGIEATPSGTTTLPGLYAVGECACTGLHGANRLASNSLLEALVCAHLTARNILANPPPATQAAIPDWTYGNATPPDEAVLIAHNWAELRTCMWDYVGIVRTDKRLERAHRRVHNLRREINEYYFDHLPTADTLELRNLADVAELIILSAADRRESRGLHYTLDYPERLPTPQNTRRSRRNIELG